DPAAARPAAANQRLGLDPRVRLAASVARGPAPRRLSPERSSVLSRPDRRRLSEVPLRSRPAAGLDVAARVPVPPLRPQRPRSAPPDARLLARHETQDR